MRSKIRKVGLNILSNKIFDNYNHNSKFIGQFIWRIKRFFKDFIGWNENISNWIEVFLLLSNIKKKVNISFKNGFVFKECSISNYFLISQFIKLIENNIEWDINNNRIVLKINNYKILYNDIKEGIRIILEVFAEDIYGKFDFKDKVIIDIGGYVGDSALYFISKGAKKVYVYETNKSVFNLLKENVILNNLENKISYFNIGVSNDFEKQTFYISKDKGSSSVNLKELYPNEVEEEITIELVPFKHILKEPIDILKMDCEGCEYAILEQILEFNLMSKIKEGIILETHYIDEKRNINYIKTLLKGIGFKINLYGKNKDMIYSTK